MDNPNEPSSLTSRTTAFMSSSSARVAGRSSQPTAQIRTGEFPRMKQMFTATLLSNIESWPATVSQSAGIGGSPLSPESSSM